MNRLTIEQIHKCKTGKVSDKWASYLPFYDDIFKNYRTQQLNLLEIGVQNGGSLETWRTFFINANNILIGCDLDERCVNLRYDDSRVHVVVGDANNPATVKKIKAVCNNFDIVIDDGSHLSSDILNSFCCYFPLLNPGGLYVIEDTHTLYMNDWGGGVLNESSANSFFKKLIDVINIQFWKDDLPIDVYFRTFFSLGEIPAFIKEGWIDSIEFRNSLILIRKSLIPTNEKLGLRLITGSNATVYPLTDKN